MDPFLSDVIAIFYLQLTTHVIAKSTIWQMISHRFNHLIIQIGVKSFFILVHNNFVVNAQISIDWKEVHLVNPPPFPKKNTGNQQNAYNTIPSNDDDSSNV